MRHIFLLVSFGLALGLFACAPANATPVIEIPIQVTEFAFEPSNLQVTVGSQIRLNLRNVGTMEHDWSVQEIDVTIVKIQPQAKHEGMGIGPLPKLHAVIKVGQTTRIEFRPEKTGTYEILCTVPGHKEAGMTGRLVVQVKPPS